MCKLFVRQVVSTVPIVLDVVLKIWKSVSKSYLNIIFECYKCIVISINNQQQFESSGVNSIKPEVFMISIKVPGLWSEREVKTANIVHNRFRITWKSATPTARQTDKRMCLFRCSKHSAYIKSVIMPLIYIRNLLKHWWNQS